MLLHNWLGSGKRSSPHTSLAYRQDIRDFLKHAGKPIELIGLSEIAAYQEYLRHEYKPATEYRKITAIRSFFTFLYLSKEIKEDVARLVSLPKVEKNFAERTLTEDEVRAMIDVARPLPLDALLIRFLYISAGRVSEVLSLTWANLIAADKQEGGGYVRIQGKGRKRREIYIGPELWDDLVRLRGEIDPDEHIFPFNRFQVWALVKRLAKAAKVSGEVSPHWFRHSHASHALEAGATLAEIRDDLGHADIKTTSLYLHADPDRATSKRLRIK